jgi:hypothetical protein
MAARARPVEEAAADQHDRPKNNTDLEKQVLNNPISNLNSD